MTITLFRLLDAHRSITIPVLVLVAANLAVANVTLRLMAALRRKP